MEPISPYSHLVKHRDEQDVDRTLVVNQNFLYVEIGNRGRYDQRIIMGEVQASQILIGEGDGLESFRHRHGEIVKLLLYLPISLSCMLFPR